MYCSQLNFLMISKALSCTIDALQNDQIQEQVLKEMIMAQKNLLQALSFSAR